MKTNLLPSETDVEQHFQPGMIGTEVHGLARKL